MQEPKSPYEKTQEQIEKELAEKKKTEAPPELKPAPLLTGNKDPEPLYRFETNKDKEQS